MNAPGPTAVDDLYVDDAPTLELPTFPPSAAPVDGGFPVGVVPPGTPPPMVAVPPSRWATRWAGLGAAATDVSSRVDAAVAQATVATRRVRATAVRQAGAAGRATGHGLVALLAAAVTLVCGVLVWALRFLRLRLPTVVVLALLVLGVRAVPWGRVVGTVRGAVDEVRTWSATTTTTTTSTTVVPGPDAVTGGDGYAPEDGSSGFDGSNGYDDGGSRTYEAPTTTEDPYPYNPGTRDDLGGQYVETVRPGQAAYRVSTSTTTPVRQSAPPTTQRPIPTTTW
ncbi:MAG: hypothetical protein ACKO04_13015 [Actinomycetes bacterium]